jgi:hypothetical protein
MARRAASISRARHHGVCDGADRGAGDQAERALGHHGGPGGNLPSINGCLNAGFEPYMLELDGSRAMRRRIRYTDLPDGYAIRGV